ncbi:MAG: hypothetical protein ACJ77E_03255 [Gaiellaceae bacterium]
MLGVRDTRRVAWRRRHAHSYYLGYVTVSDDSLRLAGEEHGTGIDVALTIPHRAVRDVRVGRDYREEVVGAPSVVLELADDDPIYLSPVDAGEVDLQSFARKLSAGS